ncbi:MAG: ABC transporter permease [Clostridiales bacterium]|nr:ABC transporter permease [Clostridiales bacterium]
MKKFFTWFYYLSKRQFKNWLFIILLLIMPLCAFGLRQVSIGIESTIKIGIVDEDNSVLSSDFISGLSEHSSIIGYTIYDNTASMEKAVLNGSVQCGYTILQGFENRVLNNSRVGLIRVYTKPESSISFLSNEIIFAKVFELCGYPALVKDIDEFNAFSNISDDEWASLKNSYETYLTNGKTFSFDYTNGDIDKTSSISITDYIKTPVRGIVALLIFLAALAGGFNYIKDKNSGFGWKMCIYDTAIPVFFCNISGIISLYIVGISGNITKEAATLLCYSLIVISFTCILSTLIKNLAIYCATIPIFVMGSIVCSPIFFNLSTFIPAMKVLQMFFMPTYYFLIFNVWN